MGERTPPPDALQSFGRCWHGVYYVEKADYGGSHPSSAARSALSGKAGQAHGVPVRRSRTWKGAAVTAACAILLLAASVAMVRSNSLNQLKLFTG